VNVSKRHRSAKVEININALRHNAQLVRQYAKNSKVMTAIKANAYGHGVLEVANAIHDIVDEYAVASMDDVLQIRQSLPESAQLPISVLSGFYSADEIELAIEHNASLVVYDLSQVHYLLEFKKSNIASNKQLNIWLKVDTGMSRLGLSCDEFESTIEQLDAQQWVNIRGVFSHFANADVPEHDLNIQQIQRFKKLKQQYNHKQWHWSMANSAAIMSQEEVHYDWVRPGIMLYGGSPLQHASAKQLNLKSVMTFSSEVISVRTVKAGQTVGYGSLWTADRDTQVAVVACGYGDGYPRCINADTPVLLNGKRSKVIGRVSMDLLVVDASQSAVSVGMPVVLWGEGLPIEEIAESVGTISYQLFCGITERVQRVLVGT